MLIDIEEFAPWRRSRRPPASTLAAIALIVVLLGLQLAGRLSWLDLSRHDSEVPIRTALLAGIAAAHHCPVTSHPTPSSSVPRCPADTGVVRCL